MSLFDWVPNLLESVHTFRVTNQPLSDQRDSKEISELASALEETLLQKYGFMLGQADLARVLAFPTATAFRRAAYRRQLPIKVFSIEHRKGKFALAKDVAIWLATMRSTQADKLKEGDVDTS
ncbi:MAG: hypothetical protein V4646_12490 [Pseudomonadota bacterium]